MKQELSVVEARESDVQGIKNLLVELIRSMQSSEGVESRRILMNCRTLMEHPHSFLIVAKDGDSVVGFINFSLRQTLLHRGPSGLIDELIITQDYRGRGVGWQLVEAAFEKCGELGCCEVEVSTEKSNEEAREFYKRCGFQEDAVLFEFHFE